MAKSNQFELLKEAALTYHGYIPAYILAQEGETLSAREAKILTEKIKSDFSDIDSRAQLLGYYSGSFNSPAGLLRLFLNVNMRRQSNYLNLIRWMIENAPGNRAAGILQMHPPGVLFDKELFMELGDLWLRKVEQHPDNAVVLGNAASFFWENNRKKSEELLYRAQALEPENSHWSSSLCQIHELQGNGQAAAKHSLDHVAKSLKEKEAAMAKSKTVNEYDLGDVAKLSFALGDFTKAEEVATRLIRLASASPMADTDDCGNGIHDGNCVLGRIALKRNDIAAAKEFLLRAGQSRGSPSLDTFGPEMDLAQDLLEKGERECVISYLRDCSRFWNGLDSRIATQYWIFLIRIGRIPKLNRVRRLREAPHSL